MNDYKNLSHLFIFSHKKMSNKKMQTIPTSTCESEHEETGLNRIKVLDNF